LYHTFYLGKVFTYDIPSNLNALIGTNVQNREKLPSEQENLLPLKHIIRTISNSTYVDLEQDKWLNANPAITATCEGKGLTKLGKGAIATAAVLATTGVVYAACTKYGVKPLHYVTDSPYFREGLQGLGETSMGGIRRLGNIGKRGISSFSKIFHNLGKTNK
jgi:hypothetical protein